MYERRISEQVVRVSILMRLFLENHSRPFGTGELMRVSGARCERTTRRDLNALRRAGWPLERQPDGTEIFRTADGTAPVSIETEDCGWCPERATTSVIDEHDGKLTPACDGCARLSERAS